MRHQVVLLLAVTVIAACSDEPTRSTERAPRAVLEASITPAAPLSFRQLTPPPYAAPESSEEGVQTAPPPHSIPPERRSGGGRYE
jgi:hypothetical protein